jgi:5-methyltetrahydropteroyltriglutamate--homocysteine methyltransferase
MFTVTKDVLLPTTVTGSWPRPRWFTLGAKGEEISSALIDADYREQLGDALAAVASDQERAGLDILTTGDYHCDNDFFGRSWANYPLERLRGLAGDHAPPPTRWDLAETHPPGTLLHEILSDWRGPHVVDRIGDDGSALEYARIWRLAQARAGKPVKFGTISAQALAGLVEIDTDVYDDDRRELVWDLSVAMNDSLRELAAAGCRVIQVEEPNFHFFAYPADPGAIDFLVDAFNREVEGLDGVEVWVHTCFGNPSMQRVFEDTRYLPQALEIYLDRLSCDVLTLEMKDRGYRDLEALAPWKDSTTRKVAVGVVSHRTLQVERPDEVADDIRRVLGYVNPENLILTSDCGFGRQGCTRSIALYKAAAVAQAANIVRRELGAPETPVPVADPGLQPAALLR